MKTLQISIIAILVLLITQTASAQPKTILDIPNLLVVCGQVVAKDNNGHTNIGGPLYTIKIENYYNGNTSNSTLTAIGSEDSNGPRGMVPIQAGQTALFYVNSREKYSILLPQTTVVQKCDSTYIPTPLGQYRFGVSAQNVYCLTEYTLVIKSEDGSPACVKSNTVSILIERGWANNQQSSSKSTNNSMSKNIVVQSISNKKLPSCATHIKKQQVFAGNAGLSLCPVVPLRVSSKIINYTGFYGVYHDIDSNSLLRNYTYNTNAEQEQLNAEGNNMAEGNFVLEPGHNATITFLITGQVPKCIENCPPGLNFPSQINITNVSSFTFNQEDTRIIFPERGLGITYEPQSETVVGNGTVIVKATISAEKDTSPGTYWVVLPPGSVCNGGILILLTVAACSN